MAVLSRLVLLHRVIAPKASAMRTIQRSMSCTESSRAKARSASAPTSGPHKFSALPISFMNKALSRFKSVGPAWDANWVYVLREMMLDSSRKWIKSKMQAELA
ncbi:hypothetical protein F2Q70_00032937 [Brassica cretica]|uniref:Uncharacterized protein n=1 Tax=Brassica cretica TaxID=69181 RepID=A0A8S9FMW0_BRACR|nr:hypothetical protein F2Q70_00032937 [Brassica cretica]